jgi:hypothetical protein
MRLPSAPKLIGTWAFAEHAGANVGPLRQADVMNAFVRVWGVPVTLG